MWDLVGLLIALLSLYAISEFVAGPEKAMEKFGRLAAAWRRGYTERPTPPET
jgi:hypothetical protein